MSRTAVLQVFSRLHTMFGQPVVLSCDGQCGKAWGINVRPKETLGEDLDDVVYLSDEELGEAPTNPGTYEGGWGKPNGPQESNKWCSRECERAEQSKPGEAVVLTDWSQRVYNQPFKHGGDAVVHKLHFDAEGRPLAAAEAGESLKTRISQALSRLGGRLAHVSLMLESFPPEQYPQAWRQLSDDGSAGCALAFGYAKALTLALRELGCVRISGVEGGVFAPDSLRLTAPGESLISVVAVRG